MSDSNEENNNSFVNKTKKRKKTGRMREVMKKMRVATHEPGNDCRCKRLKCFDRISSKQRVKLLKDFNSMKGTDDQNLYLCGLMNVCSIKRRRSRKIDEMDANFHQTHFTYKVRVIENDDTKEVPVCCKAFLSIFGITKGKLEHLQKSLKITGTAPSDKRGKSNSNKRLDINIKNLICNHIKSFKGRSSHYSLNDTIKEYLPEDLNIKKMYKLYLDANESQNHVCYETYRTIFNTEFNISFGYPRTDTCSTCDEFTIKAKALRAEGNTVELNRLSILNNLHKKKSQTFYDRKKNARMKSKRDVEFQAIAMDYQKNVSLPNITTNDVYYKRQLSMYSFNVHALGDASSYFYTYPETCGRKGSDEVVSFLFHYLTNHLDSRIKHLEIYCDSAGGQNKNYTVIRFIHFVVHKMKLLDSIKITYPVRGHSYLECDKNMGLINLKTHMEVPYQWYDLLRVSRQRPKPFEVIEVGIGELIRKFSEFFQNQ
ncbi:unnamed protein product [Euphydryas editha]|uniref:DUF7869 domain-containing protein n=1 Tax=Euphydryas editha TaxID=104508 RepID=A0AAU9U3C8_EUPED|nr:unnamed protein product [Euphydryas editha]